MVREQRQEIEIAINALWEMYDDAEKSGNIGLAADFAGRAFQLLGKLPENQVFLSTKQ